MLFTSESVTVGHPDKVCDQISDAILDAYLEGDENSRVACECLIGKGILVISGEITSKAEIDIKKVAKLALIEIGYDSSRFEIILNISKQSPDIALGVDSGGAGDQGMVHGYANRDTKVFMPAPIFYAHKLTNKLREARIRKEIPYLLPDGKSQVTFKYNKRRAVSVDTIVVSTHHLPEIILEELKTNIRKKVINPCFIDFDLKNTKIYINPTGKFEIGGPIADTGMTGRKIVVDSYGGMGCVGGGCQSGKDPSKIDRSGAYMARYIAKYLIANNYANEIDIQLGYVIGVQEPVSIYINTFDTGRILDRYIAKFILKKFDLTPNGIINFLDLKKPIYRKTAENGHYGHEYFPWEILKD